MTFPWTPDLCCGLALLVPPLSIALAYFVRRCHWQKHIIDGEFR